VRVNRLFFIESRIFIDVIDHFERSKECFLTFLQYRLLSLTSMV
jgi:hypothetical protein